eukprot:Lankesteria_metandrocarpae@DN9909_c0_g1_i1.p1
MSSSSSVGASLSSTNHHLVQSTTTCDNTNILSTPKYESFITLRRLDAQQRPPVEGNELKLCLGTDNLNNKRRHINNGLVTANTIAIGNNIATANTTATGNSMSSRWINNAKVLSSVYGQTSSPKQGFIGGMHPITNKRFIMHSNIAVINETNNQMNTNTANGSDTSVCVNTGVDGNTNTYYSGRALNNSEYIDGGSRATDATTSVTSANATISTNATNGASGNATISTNATNGASGNATISTNATNGASGNATISTN